MTLITMVINNLYVGKLIIIMIITVAGLRINEHPTIHHDCFILFRYVVHGYSKRTIIQSEVLQLVAHG